MSSVGAGEGPQFATALGSSVQDEPQPVYRAFALRQGSKAKKENRRERTREDRHNGAIVAMFYYYKVALLAKLITTFTRGRINPRQPQETILGSANSSPQIEVSRGLPIFSTVHLLLHQRRESLLLIRGQSSLDKGPMQCKRCKVTMHEIGRSSTSLLLKCTLSSSSRTPLCSYGRVILAQFGSANHH